ncbi:hypothetical protein ACGGKE_18100 (plasmid) [Sphingobium naphthae]|uniref:hypothetical protein n=1 Tax=Sphingobium naphthae TaxID=1886786 RepID=UPI000C930497|nr:hypothetical protein [Erythrobacter sp.]MEA3388290.1 hypothetical protein [Pseudomonadota bacterium]|tara:strand:+ start:1800 stop:2141 length:342 start_codon:yes stop_codon:yes gene_type:complete
MVLLRSLRAWRGPRRLHGLLDLGYAAYGLGTLVLVLAFMVAPLSPHGFLRLFAVLLLLLAICLGGDGLLGLLTSMDRTGKRWRVGRPARTFANLKIGVGTLAIVLFSIGISPA